MLLFCCLCCIGRVLFICCFLRLTLWGGAGRRVSAIANCTVTLVPSMHCGDLCQADNFRGASLYFIFLFFFTSLKNMQAKKKRGAFGDLFLLRLLCFIFGLCACLCCIWAGAWTRGCCAGRARQLLCRGCFCCSVFLVPAPSSASPGSFPSQPAIKPALLSRQPFLLCHMLLPFSCRVLGNQG